ncbi:glycosyltransferase, partial [Candidatus Bathyarchaeota archaeon]|nr:glycosyltransferase [Candidatus Bathyarchaeota archaeon]
CLMHVLNQSYKPCEIIVVDGGSTDRTRKIATAYGAKVLVEPPHKGNYPGIGRNYGAKNSLGKILSFLDSDCYPERNWLMKVNKIFNNKNVGVYGVIVRDGNSSDLSKAYHYLIREINYDFVPSRCMSIRRSVFEKINGFDETLTAGEDNDLSYKVRNLGYKIIIDKDTLVFHDDDHLNSLKGIWRQQKWYFEAEKELRKRMPYRFKRFRTSASMKEHLLPLIKAFWIGGLSFALNCLTIKLISLRKHL